MSQIINTPKPPYYAVIFTSKKIDEDKGYSKMAGKELWYKQYKVRIAKVERDYEF